MSRSILFSFVIQIIILINLILITAHEDHSCELQSLTLTNTIQLYPSFSPQQHDYYCTQRSFNPLIDVITFDYNNNNDDDEVTNLMKINDNHETTSNIDANDENIPDVVQLKAIVHAEAAQRVTLLLIHQGDQPFDASITAPIIHTPSDSSSASSSSSFASMASSTLSKLKSKFIRNMQTMSSSTTISRRKDRSKYYHIGHSNLDELPSVIYELKDGILSPVLPISSGNTTFIIQVTGEGAMNEGSPARCERTYTIHCDTSLLIPPMYAHIRGLLNQAIGIRVIPQEVYNLLNDFNVQVNGRFLYHANVNESEISTSKVHLHGSKDHDSDVMENFAYVSELGIRTAAGAKIEIKAGANRYGFYHVLFNGHHMTIGDTQYLANIENDQGYKPTSTAFIRFESKSRVSLQVSSFSIEIINKHNYLEMRTSLIDWEDISSHGLIGQTWRRLPTIKSTKKLDASFRSTPISVHEDDLNKWIEGDVTDYILDSKNLFGTDYKFNRFDVHNDE